jgi:hypothetical protein
MRLDPDTLVRGLILAIPTSAVVFDKFGISLTGNEDKTLGQICANRRIRFEEFLHALDEIDWNEELPEARDTTGT